MRTKWLVPLLLIPGCGRPVTDADVVAAEARKAGAAVRGSSQEEVNAAYVAFLRRYSHCPPTVELETVMSREFFRGAKP